MYMEQQRRTFLVRPSVVLSLASLPRAELSPPPTLPSPFAACASRPLPGPEEPGPPPASRPPASPLRPRELCASASSLRHRR